MLNLDLMKSRAGREIYQMGEVKGKIVGELTILQRLLERRFGKLPRPVQIRLENATLAELDQWSSVLLTANSLEEIFNG